VSFAGNVLGLSRLQTGSVAKFDFRAKSKNRASGIQ
jgi:hypothetical protein